MADSATRTRLPPSPSTILPDRTSLTDRWNRPPKKLSKTLPRAPQITMNPMNLRRSSIVHGAPPAGVRDDSSLQDGRNIMDAVTIIIDPSKPAPKPSKVTPPFVPRGTFRSVGDVISRGCPEDRIPSSELKVSAATAA